MTSVGNWSKDHADFIDLDVKQLAGKEEVDFLVGWGLLKDERILEVYWET